MAEKLGYAAGKDFLEEFRHGEGYMKSPELVRQFVDNMPIMEIPKKYVVFKPLTDVVPGEEEPQVIVFLADPDQLAALVVLANYGREGNENVTIPFAAGCQQVGIFPYREGRSESPGRSSASRTSRHGRILKTNSTGMYSPLPSPGGCSRRWKRTWRGAFCRKRHGRLYRKRIPQIRNNPRNEPTTRTTPRTDRTGHVYQRRNGVYRGQGQGLWSAGAGDGISQKHTDLPSKKKVMSTMAMDAIGGCVAMRLPR